jgi:hypothetical protein
MTPILRLTATLVLVASALGAGPASAAQKQERPGDGSVCVIAYDFCVAACDINSPDSGLGFNEYIANQACKHQCEEDLNTCLGPGEGSKPARKQSVRKLIGPIFGMDDTPPDNDDKPAGHTKPPADPTGGQGDGGGFDPNTIFGGGTLVFSPN